MKTYALPLVLLLVFAAQITLIRVEQKDYEALSGPAAGSVLPPLTIRLNNGSTVDLRSMLTSTAGCSIVVFADVNCSVCRRMRHTWVRQFREMRSVVKAEITAVWLFGSSTRVVEEFLDGFDASGVVIAQVLDVEGAIDSFGVIGTPLAFLVDRDGRIRMGIAGNRLPPYEEVAEACE